MAFTELLQAPEPPHFYDVHAAVGRGAPNRRDDTMLVQHLLREVYSRPAAFAPPLVPPSGPPITVDGVAGPQTFEWILHFQKELKARGRNIATDGRIDRARGAVGLLSGTVYTILFLNSAFLKARPDVPYLWQASDCSELLKEALINNSRPVDASAPQVPASGGA